MGRTQKSSLKAGGFGLEMVQRSKSVLAQDAQTPTACAVPELESRRAWASEVVEKVARMRGHRDAIVLDLLLFSGCRVSEVCNIAPEDILSNTQVLIHGLKGSGNRICTLGVMTDFLEFKFRKSWMWSQGLNRWYVYRICKEYGVYETILGNKNLAVTHSGRHELIIGLRKAGLEPAEIAELIGHKNVESTKHYLRHRPQTGFVGDDKKF